MYMFLVMVIAPDGMIVSCHSKKVLLMCMFLVMVTAPYCHSKRGLLMCIFLVMVTAPFCHSERVLLMNMFLVMVTASDDMIVSSHSKRVLLMCITPIMLNMVRGVFLKHVFFFYSDNYTVD